MSPEPSIIAVIPTYNEAQNLERLIDRIVTVQPNMAVLVVDDNSPDGTGEIAGRLSREHPHVHVLHRAEKDGLGGAYRAGFRWAMNHGYDTVVQMDADTSHQPEQLTLLLEQLQDHDMVIGSRWVDDGRVVGWAKHRELLSRAGGWYARTVLRLPYADVTGGFRVFRREALKRAGVLNTQANGYGFQVETLLRAHRAGVTVKEVPITFTERAAGKSKMGFPIIWEAFWNVTRWAVRR